MAERQPSRGASPSTTPDNSDVAGSSQTAEPLKTAAEVAASRLTEMEEGRATPPGAGEAVSVKGRPPIAAEVLDVIRRYPASSMLVGLGIGFGIGLLVGRCQSQASTPATV